MRLTNGNFDQCNSCKRLGTSRLHELHQSKFPFVSRIEFIRSKLSNFSAHVSGITDVPDGGLSSGLCSRDSLSGAERYRRPVVSCETSCAACRLMQDLSGRRPPPAGQAFHRTHI